MEWLKKSVVFGLTMVMLTTTCVLSGCSTTTPEAAPKSYGHGSVSSKYRNRDRTYSRSSTYEAPAPVVRKPVRRSPVVRKPAPVVRRDPAPVLLPAPVASPVPVVVDPSDAAGTAYWLKAGDAVVIYLRGIPEAEMIEDVVDEMGYITLPYVNAVQAAGLTSSGLERAIRAAYMDERIYKDITVNVVLPSQGYFVRGEVKKPGRYPLMSGATVLQAIVTAGGYTEFAKPSNVQLLRGGTTRKLNAEDFEKHPERDVAIEVGDVIVVNRSIW